MENLPEIPRSIWEQLKDLSIFLRSWRVSDRELELCYYIPEGAVDFTTLSIENMIQHFNTASFDMDYTESVFDNSGCMVRDRLVLGRHLTLTMDLPTETEKLEIIGEHTPPAE